MCSVMKPFQLDGNVGVLFMKVKSNLGELFTHKQIQLQQKWTLGRTAGGPGPQSQARRWPPLRAQWSASTSASRWLLQPKIQQS